MKLSEMFLVPKRGGCCLLMAAMLLVAGGVRELQGGEEDLIVLDQFAGYTDGKLSGQGEGFGWGGNWSGTSVFQVTNALRLTHSSLSNVVAGGSGVIGVEDGEWINVARLLETPLTNGPVYLGFLINTGDSDQNHARVFLRNEDQNYQVGAGIWGKNGLWQLTRRDGSTGWGSENSDVSVTSNSTYFVLKLTRDDRWRAALFVNPADADALGDTPQVTYTFATASVSEAFTRVGMQRNKLPADPAPDRVLFDEIRIGTTPASMFSRPPAMQVLHAGDVIAVGETNAFPVTIGTPVSREYVVTNINSSVNLVLTNSPHAVVFSESGTTNYNGFTITSNITGSATNLAPGESASFSVQFSTDTAGTNTATVSIGNDDPDKNPYTFEVRAVTRVYLLRSNASGVADWTTAADWSDLEAPSDAKDYLATALLRSPTSTGVLKFGGRSLTIGGSGTLALLRGDSGVTTIDNLTLESGSLTTYNDNRTHTLQSAQPIQVGGSFRFTSRNNNANTTTVIIDQELVGSGNITIEGRGSDITDKDNRVQFNQANTYSGTVRMLYDVTFIVAHANAVQYLTLNMQSGDDGRVTFNQDSTVGGLMGVRDIDFGTRVISVGNNDEDTTYSGEISNGSLTKLGTGTLTLAGTNTYTGVTTVNAGTLRVDGSLAAGSAVTVNNGGKLAGAGTISGNLTIEDNGVFLADGGALTVGGAITLNEGAVLDARGAPNRAFIPIMCYGSLSGAFESIQVPAGWAPDWSIDYAFAHDGKTYIAIIRKGPTVFLFR